MDPVTSQKSTVTVLRWARGATAATKGAPQLLQKAASPGFSRPQVVQVLTTTRVCLSYNPGSRQSAVDGLTGSTPESSITMLTMSLQLLGGHVKEPRNCRLGD